MVGNIKKHSLWLGLMAGAMTMTGCTQVRGHQGYIADEELMSAVQAGIDNRQSVEASLGRPTFTGQFDDNTWYYLSREGCRRTTPRRLRRPRRPVPTSPGAEHSPASARPAGDARAI